MDFIHDDARRFNLPQEFDGAVSIFDSLNHVMTLGELELVFANVFRALLPGGLFFFDPNMEEAYEAQWKDSVSPVLRDHVLIMRFRYNREGKTGRADITMFRLEEGNWRRSDVTLRQRAYAEEEVVAALPRKGFMDISALDVAADLGVDAVLGRTFFLSRRPDPRKGQ